MVKTFYQIKIAVMRAEQFGTDNVPYTREETGALPSPGIGFSFAWLSEVWLSEQPQQPEGVSN